MNTLERFQVARRCSCPIVAINTPDPTSTMKLLEDGLEVPVIQWDIARGLAERNQEGLNELSRLGHNKDMDDTVGNPPGAILFAEKLVERSIMFVHMSNRYLDDVNFIQAVWNVRDLFKRNTRTLVLLGTTVRLPSELEGNVVSIDEPLPDSEQLETIVNKMHDAAGLETSDDDREKAVEALQGLPSFQAEQVVAMSLRKDGMRIDELWESKRHQIESTPGLSVSRDGITFDDLGGLPQIKKRLRGIFAGNNRPRCVVWIDEIEKSLAGAGTDTSGVSTDQLGTLLTYMQDHNARGMIFVGASGAGKSAVAKAAGNEAGVPTVRLDLGAMRQQYVGMSEQRVRESLKVISAVGSDQSIWIATCNSLEVLPPELKRRFKRGIYFFDLPTDEERTEIWKVYCAKYGVKYESVNDTNWTGAEIEQCCETAYDENLTLDEASEHIVPVSQSAAHSIQMLRDQADNRFLDASHPGVFLKEREESKERQIEI